MNTQFDYNNNDIKFSSIIKDQRQSQSRKSSQSPKHKYQLNKYRGHMHSQSSGQINVKTKTEPHKHKNSQSINQSTSTKKDINRIINLSKNKTLVSNFENTVTIDLNNYTNSNIYNQSILEDKTISDKQSIAMICDYQNKENSQQIQINLYEDDTLIENISYQIFGKTTTDLGLFILEKLNRNQPGVIGFETIENNIPLDYYLTQKLRSLTNLCGTTLNLRPLVQSGSNQITLRSFKFLKNIGIGGFSRVFLVRSLTNGQFLALKMIRKQFILENKKIKLIKNERDVMVKLCEQNVEPHPFLCRLQCAFETKQWIVFGMEYCPGSELFQQLRRVKTMTEQEARFYFIEVCVAILHLHQSGILYRDIKPENILIDLDGHVRVGDFGLARLDINEQDDLAYSFCGSPEYMAPEMLKNDGHNQQIDHYCLGALLYEMLTGLPPFYSVQTDVIYKNILSKQIAFPENIILSDMVLDLITKLLCKDPAQRLGKDHGVFEILSHPWLRKTQLQAVISKQLVPSFLPNQLEYNFDPCEFEKGQQEFLEELELSYNNLDENNFQQLFTNFNYISNEMKSISTNNLSINHNKINIKKSHSSVHEINHKQNQTKTILHQSIQINKENNQTLIQDKQITKLILQKTPQKNITPQAPQQQPIKKMHKHSQSTATDPKAQRSIFFNLQDNLHSNFYASNLNHKKKNFINQIF